MAAADALERFIPPRTAMATTASRATRNEVQGREGRSRSGGSVSDTAPGYQEPSPPAARRGKEDTRADDPMFSADGDAWAKARKRHPHGQSGPPLDRKGGKGEVPPTNSIIEAVVRAQKESFASESVKMRNEIRNELLPKLDELKEVQEEHNERLDDHDYQFEALRCNTDDICGKLQAMQK